LGADNGRRVDWAEREHLGACPELRDTANGGLRVREAGGRAMNTTVRNVACYGSAYRAPAAGTRQTLWRGDQGGVCAARKPLARLHAARNVALRRRGAIGVANGRRGGRDQITGALDAGCVTGARFGLTACIGLREAIGQGHLSWATT
jgi:hypothetical protein